MNSFYQKEELLKIGLKSVGDNVFISKKCSIYSPHLMSIGNNVRIDDFCILSGNITLHNNIHISAFSALYGGGGIVLEDYSGLSPRCTLLSVSDDFSGDFFIGPHLHKNITNVQTAPIFIRAFSQLGANTIVMPGVTIGQGAVTGVLSFVNKNLEEWTIYAGIPAKKIKLRSRKMLKLLPK